MATLAGRTIANSYTELLKTVAGTGIPVTPTFTAVEDGDATVSALQLNTTQVKVAGTLEVTGASTLTGATDVAGAFSVATNKLTVAAATGNTAVAGTLTVASTTESTTKDTGCVILEGGLGVEKNIVAGGYIASFGSMTSTGSFLCESVVTVNGTTNLKGAVLLGDAAADTITVTGTLAGSPGTTAKATPTTADSILITDAAAAGAFKSATVANIVAAALTKSAVTAAVPAAAATATIAHTLAGTPQQVRVVLRCTDATTAAGYAVGDEVNMEAVYDNSARTALQFYADATNVKVIRRDTDAFLYILHKTTGAQTDIQAETAKWRLKAYSLYLA